MRKELDLVDEFDPIVFESHNNDHEVYTLSVIYDDSSDLGYSIRLSIDDNKQRHYEYFANCLNDFNLSIGKFEDFYYINVCEINMLDLQCFVSKDQTLEIIDLFLDLYQDYKKVCDSFATFRNLVINDFCYL